jgi:D-glycero-D-manno-heptose 1,7-bisphosphate phosphatase
MKKRAKTTVFIDRDGTINVNLPFPNVNTPEKLEILPGAARGIKELNNIGCRVLIVTNQAGINNPANSLTLSEYNRITDRLKELLSDETGAFIDDEFCCPHTRDEGCTCRKPGTGLYLKAKEKYSDIRFDKSFVIGDRDDDIIAGKKLDMTTILVRTGHGTSTEADCIGKDCEADFVVNDLLSAAFTIREIIQNH